MSVQEHRQHAPSSVDSAVITVSDTRTEETDTSGRTIREKLEGAGHRIVVYQILKDEPAAIEEMIRSLAAEKRVRAVLLNGGTGIAGRDTTHEAVARLLEKKLDGFGELFRMLSFQEIGAAAMLSRAVAGVYQGMAVFSMPGSTAAVRLAMDRLILPELAHVVREISK